MHRAMQDLMRDGDCLYGLPFQKEKVSTNSFINVFLEDVYAAICLVHPWHPFDRTERINFLIFQTTSIMLLTALLASAYVPHAAIWLIGVVFSLIIDQLWRYMLKTEGKKCFCVTSESFLLISCLASTVCLISGLAIGVQVEQYFADLTVTLILRNFVFRNLVKFIAANVVTVSITVAGVELFRCFEDQKKDFQKKYGPITHLGEIAKDITDVPSEHSSLWKKTFEPTNDSNWCKQMSNYKSEEHDYWGTSFTYVLTTVKGYCGYEVTKPRNWRNDCPYINEGEGNV